MNRLLRHANKRISLGNAAALLILVALFGQALGFLRVKLINANFQAFGPQSTDAFFAAFKIPDFFFYTIAAGALGVAFIPVLSDHLERYDKKGAWELATSLLNVLAVVMGFVGVIILIFAEPLVHLVAPGLDPAQKHTAATLMRLISFNPLLFTLSGIITAVQQTFGRFFFFAIAPLFYNVSIIISSVVFSVAAGHNGGPGHLGLVGLGIGALAGAILQLLIACFGLYGADFHWRPKVNWRNNDFKLILRQLPPRSIDQGMDSINSIVETNFASKLGTSSISYYENAYTLHTVPIQLIGTTISTAAFPRLSARLSQNRPDLFRKEFLQVLRAMIWIIMPVIVVSYFARGYLARLIFAKGAPEIALIFGYLTVAILFRTIYSIISRWFYAQKDTRTPLFISLFAIALNIFLAYKLSQPNPDGYGVSGLAMAQSIVAATEVVILSLVMLVRDHKLFNVEFWSGVLRIVSVTGFSVLTGFIMISLLPLQAGDRGIVTLGVKLSVISGVIFFVHVLISTIYGLEEPRPILSRVRQVMLKPIKTIW